MLVVPANGLGRFCWSANARGNASSTLRLVPDSALRDESLVPSTARKHSRTALGDCAGGLNASSSVSAPLRIALELSDEASAPARSGSEAVPAPMSVAH